MLPNFKAVRPIEAELHILKVEKLDACIRPLFANSITYVATPCKSIWYNYDEPVGW